MDKEERVSIPVTIHCGFSSLEQKLVFEALVLPEITSVLNKYAALLGYEEFNV